MKFLPSLGRVKSAEVERATGLARYRYGRAYTPPTRAAADVDRAVSETHDRTTWVFRCVQAIAFNQARLPVEVRKDDPVKGAPIEAHPLLEFLNFRASAFESSFFFRARMSAQLLLSARGVFVEMIRTNGGDVSALHLLPPHLTRPIPDPDTFVSGYEVSIGGRAQVVPAEDVLWLRNPHPIDPYRSMTPIEAAAIAIDADYLARLYNATFLRNDGRPGGLIAVKGHLLPTDADELKSYFAGGAGNAGEWRVIEADDIAVEDMATTPRDMQYAEMRGASKEEILIAHGCPETVLGNASGRTFDNADAEKEVFWQETMLPHLDLIGSALDQADGDASTFVAFDTSGVDALQRSERERRAELRDEVQQGLISIDEYREATGRDPFEEPGTQSLYVGFTATPIAGPVLGQPAPTPTEVIDVQAADVPPQLQAASLDPGEAGRKSGPFRSIEGGRP